jgi:Amidohydrolase
MAGRTPLSELLIVDADVHVHESPGALAPYCDAPWDVALRSVADVPERYLDIPGFSPGGDGTLTARFPTSHEATRMVHTPEQMVSELGEIGVDLAVLFPDHLLKIAVLPQADYAAALARAYNAWLIEEWTSRHDALLAAIVACPQDPADAAREIERHADRAVAVYLPCAGLDPLWGHRRYDPIFDAAQNADLPVLLHAVTVTSPVFPFNNHGFDTEFARHSTSHTFSIMANARRRDRRLPVARARVPRADRPLPGVSGDRDPLLRRRRRRRGRDRQPRIQPPSTSSVWPLTKPLSSPAKNAIARATSSTSPRRLIDCASSTPLHSASWSAWIAVAAVGNAPGATALTRIPSGPASRASDRVKPITAPLDAT